MLILALLVAIAVEKAGLIHADLKTENVLLLNPESSLLQDDPKVFFPA